MLTFHTECRTQGHLVMLHKACDGLTKPRVQGEGGEAKKTYVLCHLPEIRGMKLLECHAPILLQVGQLGVYYRLGGARGNWGLTDGIIRIV